MIRLVLLLLGIAIGVGASLWLEHERSPAPDTSDEATRRESPDDDDDDDIPARVRRVDGSLRVVLSPAEIAAAGILVAPAQIARTTHEQQAFGRVADPTGLLALVRELRAAGAAAAAQHELVRAVESRLERLRGFSARGEIAVSKELADLEIEYRRMRDVAGERRARVDALRTNLRSSWGGALAALALAESAHLAALEAGEAQLLEFAAASPPPGTVFATAGDERTAARPVTVLGPAAAVLGSGQSASYFGLAQAPELRVGMRLSVWIPQDAAVAEGVLLPPGAVVWHRGQTWFFVAVAPGSFERRPVGAALPHVDGSLLVGRSPPGDIVVRGAQALLAEEFREQIPEEDDD
jgi:hypothetical protein